jgi:hypothetical protein
MDVRNEVTPVATTQRAYERISSGSPVARENPPPP